ncbi:MAG TPA: hypothetical protein VFQ65_03280, partial [Kofleriaceae bacterium]|nr:hypothetical protein [Kofleriaceae bacterium]
MPRRKDLESILIIGSGPIVIGQACEFDYSGTQACKALREEGLRVVLINSNPATIMTDPELADATYVEPLTVEVLDKVLAREKVSAILPTLGGQTGLNLAMAAHKAGLFEKHGVELLGATVIESPVCTPIGSRFSIEHTITLLSLPSRTTSSSYSFQPSTLSST